MSGTVKSIQAPKLSVEDCWVPISDEISGDKPPLFTAKVNVLYRPSAQLLHHSIERMDDSKAKHVSLKVVKMLFESS